MKRLTIIFYILVMTLLTGILFSCSTNSSKTKDSSNSDSILKINKSRVLSFDYSAYGDNVYSTLEGQVLQLDASIQTSDSLKPVINATINSFNADLTLYKTVYSDSTGRFVMEFPKGTFSLSFSKDCYQTLKVDNYISDPDQISSVIVLLEEGNYNQTFRLHNKKTK